MNRAHKEEDTDNMNVKHFLKRIRYLHLLFIVLAVFGLLWGVVVSVSGNRFDGLVIVTLSTVIMYMMGEQDANA